MKTKRGSKRKSKTMTMGDGLTIVFGFSIVFCAMYFVAHIIAG